MSEDPANNVEKRKNRKRKKNFLQNARKYAKKGTFGRGSHLSEDTYQYFVRVLETNKEGFPDEEEKSIFVNNVFEQTVNEEINYSCNQIGCRVIETLLPFANDDVLKRFMSTLGSELRPLCSDRFASHVIQSLLCISCSRSLGESDETTKATYKDFTLRLSKFLLNNLEDYISDTYGTHIIRSILMSLAQIPKEETAEVTDGAVPSEYSEVVSDYGERLSSWPHFKDLPYEELSSGLLQVLLRALKKVNLKLLSKILKLLIDESFSVKSEDYEDVGNNLLDVFQSKPAIMLLETALLVALPKSFTQLYAKCFTGNLALLAKMKDTNFTVQKLLMNCREKEEFESMFDELADHFEEILTSGHTGVVLSLAKTAKRLATKQGHFIQLLMKALHCLEPQDRQNSFVPAVTRLIPYERLQEAQKQHFFVNLHGSIVVQTMLEFNKPIKVVGSILSMEPNDLKQLFCDIRGSHIVDSYVKSAYVGEKSREKLIRRLQGTYQELAGSKYGSRSFDSIWSVCNLKQRMNVLNELCHKEAAWSTGEFGRIIANKVNLQLYKRSKDEWRGCQDRTGKTKELFADILEEK